MNWTHFLSKLDRVGILSALFVCVISSGWLVYDYRFKDQSDTSKLVALGKINPLKNQTRRKHEEGLTWYDIHSSKPVYNGDQIYTGNEATAEIILDDGSILKLEASTLITLNYNDRLNLNLQFGSFSGDLKGKAIIKSGNEIIDANSSQFSLTKNAEGLDIDLKNGDLKSGTQKIEKGLKSLTQGKITKLEKNIELLNPEDNSLVWLKPNEKLSLSWKSPKPMDYAIEFSTTPNFSKVLFSQQTKESHLDISFNYFQTEVYWRVVGIAADQSRSVSETYRFNSELDIAPELIKPVSGTNLLGDITDTKHPKGADLSWMDVSELWNEFELQVSTDTEFKNIIFSDKNNPNKDKSVIIEKTGTYYWRVRGHLVDKKHYSPWSETNNFFIRVNTPDPLQPPMLITNQITYSISPRDLVNYDESQNIIYLDTTTGFPILDWTPVEQTLGYKLTFANDPELKQIIKTAKVKKDQYHYLQPQVSNYYWGVQAIYKDGSLGPLSKSGAINVKKPYPEPRPAQTWSESVDYTEREKVSELDISWTRLPLKKGYEVQWSTESNFNHFQRTLTVKDTAKLPFTQSGKVYWRVRAANRDKTPFSPFSPIQTLSYDRKIANIPAKVVESEAKKLASLVPPVDAPTILQPTTDKVYISSKNQDSFVLMKWEYGKDFDNYEIEISSDPDFKDVILTEKTTDSKMILNKKLSQGQYYWRVRTTSGELKKEWTKTHSFKIKKMD